MRRFAFALLPLLLLFLAGCGMMQKAGPGEAQSDNLSVPQSAAPSDDSLSENTVYRSNISAENCRLCGSGTDSGRPSPWGQNSIALISLNTFEIMPVGINRYDGGQPVEEVAGYGSIEGGTGKDGGFSATLICDHDRGYATGFVCFHDDEVLDINKMADFLCEDCLNEILPTYPDRCFGAGAIDLATKEVRIFAEGLHGFTLGGFYIDCDLQDQENDQQRMDILIFYCPIRYETKA